MANQRFRSRFRRNLGPIICTLIYVVVLVQLFAEDTSILETPGIDPAILAMSSTSADYRQEEPTKIADLKSTQSFGHDGHDHDGHNHSHQEEGIDADNIALEGAATKSICQNSKCTSPKFVYSAGDREFVLGYCEEHSPRCNSISCNEIVEHSYDGGTPLKFCASHRSTCHHEGCYNRASASSSIFQENKPRYCPDHTQECSNPTCDKPKLSRITRDGYEAYCEDHKHTCQRKNCYAEAMPGNSTYHNGYSRFCEEHTEKCSVPSCSKVRKRMAMSNAFLEVCEDHEMICDVASCFDMSIVSGHDYNGSLPSRATNVLSQYLVLRGSNLLVWSLFFVHITVLTSALR